MDHQWIGKLKEIEKLTRYSILTPYYAIFNTYVLRFCSSFLFLHTEEVRSLRDLEVTINTVLVGELNGRCYR